MTQRLILAEKKARDRSREEARATILAVNRLLSGLCVHNPDNLSIRKLGIDANLIPELDPSNERQAAAMKRHIEKGDLFLGKILKSLSRSRFKPVSSHYRMIYVTDDPVQKERQHYWAKRLGGVPSHKSAWGFCRGKNCYDACMSHITYWGTKKAGDMSFMSMDIENFFPSITDSMVRPAMAAHGFTDEEIEDCIASCMFSPSLDVGGHMDSILDRVSGNHRMVLMSKKYRETLLGMLSGTVHCSPDRTRLDVLEFGEIQIDGLRIREDYVSVARELIYRFILGINRGSSPGTEVLIQGSPASPALSNLVAKRMDYRFDAFARKTGTFYSRYADDVVISWKGRRTMKNLKLLMYSMGKIIDSSGFVVRKDKTVIKGPGMRQSMLGYNVNSGRVTVSRHRRERVYRFLEAALSSKIVNVPALMSVAGEVEFIATAHPLLGEKLRDMCKTVSKTVGMMPGNRVIEFGQPVDMDVEEARPRKITYD